MTKEIEIKIWSRDFVLPVHFESYTDKPITEEQQSALITLVSTGEWLDNALLKVKEYSAKALEADKTNDKKDNVFSYVKPESIFVEYADENSRVAIMCKYRYDLEHGLAIVFSNDGQIEVGLQDIIL